MQPESVEVTRFSATTGKEWNPVLGQETIGLLSRLGLGLTENEDVWGQAQEILGRCLPPEAPGGHRTGLVIGYVQSGKTLSFTTVTALARDNRYRMIIVLTGTSLPLLKQSTERLEKDLRLNERYDRKWKAFQNPKLSQLQSIENALRGWTDPQIPKDDCQTVLITVIKNVAGIRKLTELLHRLNDSLAESPVLIIDDEADQAGLNNKVKEGDQSSTYRQILSMRNALPHCTYLQYTATPQAPLLINIIDVLSPSFVWVLKPGENYTGGKAFFREHPKLVEVIPENDIPNKDEELHEPPPSLHRAMYFFFLGVAAGLIGEEKLRNRSMMVHPSQETEKHNDYHLWIKEAKDRWVRILGLPESDLDRTELLRDFHEIYKILQRDVTDLPLFIELVKTLPRAIRDTVITKVNSKQAGGTPPINWGHDYAHILVGGQALDRGFTVEGLTVTYMPRGIGIGNADTVQQRARFFGYKSGYLGFCRIFLSQNTKNAFSSYVEHEELIRAQLMEVANKGTPLSEWKRAFFLDPIFQPTRDSILDLRLYRYSHSDWFTPSSPHVPSEAIQHNRQVVNDFFSTLEWIDAPGHPERTESQIHKRAVASLYQVYEGLLTKIMLGQPSDSRHFTAILIQIEHYLRQDPARQCVFYEMSRGSERLRSLNNADEIKELFQGAYPDKRGAIYPGDRAIMDQGLVTIQIHRLVLRGGKGSEVPEVKGVVAIAVHLPGKEGGNIIVQEGPC